jgi:hypothetical protein
MEQENRKDNISLGAKRISSIVVVATFVFVTSFGLSKHFLLLYNSRSGHSDLKGGKNAPRSQLTSLKSQNGYVSGSSHSDLKGGKNAPRSQLTSLKSQNGYVSGSSSQHSRPPGQMQGFAPLFERGPWDGSPVVIEQYKLMFFYYSQDGYHRFKTALAKNDGNTRLARTKGATYPAQSRHQRFEVSL